MFQLAIGSGGGERGESRESEERVNVVCGRGKEAGGILLWADRILFGARRVNLQFCEVLVGRAEGRDVIFVISMVGIWVDQVDCNPEVRLGENTVLMLALKGGDCVFHLQGDCSGAVDLSDLKAPARGAVQQTA